MTRLAKYLDRVLCALVRVKATGMTHQWPDDTSGPDARTPSGSEGTPR